MFYGEVISYIPNHELLEAADDLLSGEKSIDAVDKDDFNWLRSTYPGLYQLSKFIKDRKAGWPAKKGKGGKIAQIGLYHLIDSMDSWLYDSIKQSEGDELIDQALTYEWLKNLDGISLIQIIDRHFSQEDQLRRMKNRPAQKIRTEEFTASMDEFPALHSLAREIGQRALDERKSYPESTYYARGAALGILAIRETISIQNVTEKLQLDA